MFRPPKVPWARIWFAFLLFFLMPDSTAPTFGQSEGPTAPVDPQVLEEIAEKGETTFWVFLEQKADLAPAALLVDWSERGRFVYDTLRAVADRSQAALRSVLLKRGAAFTPFWIVNAIQVTGGSALLDELVQRTETEVWSTFGVRGEGIVVASLDTGVQYDHPALAAHIVNNSWGGYGGQWFRELS